MIRRRQRPWWAPGVRLVLLGALLPGAMSCDGVPPGDGILDPPAVAPDAAAAARIGPGVTEALARDRGARVVIALAPAPAPAPDGTAGLRFGVAGPPEPAVVAERVDGMLARVGPEGFRVERRFSAVTAVAGTVRSEAALARLAADEAVRRIDLDVGGGGALGGSVAQIGADARHASNNDGAGVVVAILDSGVDAGHPALADRIQHQACFGRPPAGSGGFCPNGTTRQVGDGAATDGAGHGTHVTGIVAANGAGGVTGVAPGVGIVALKVLDDATFSGRFYAFSEIIAALDYIITNQATLNVRVINMSLGTDVLFGEACDHTTAFNMAGAQAINTLRAMGVIALAASMNSNSPTQMASPACLENVVSVGAVDRDDAVPSFSNGNAVTDLLAPGVDILSTAIGGGVIGVTGTSMAAPHAAGCAALLIQATPSILPSSLRARLRNSPVLVTDPKNNLTLPRIDCAPDDGGPGTGEPDTGPPDPRRSATTDRPS